MRPVGPNRLSQMSRPSPPTITVRFGGGWQRTFAPAATCCRARCPGRRSSPASCGLPGSRAAALPRRSLDRDRQPEHERNLSRGSAGVFGRHPRSADHPPRQSSRAAGDFRTGPSRAARRPTDDRPAAGLGPQDRRHCSAVMRGRWQGASAVPGSMTIGRSAETTSCHRRARLGATTPSLVTTPEGARTTGRRQCERHVRQRSAGRRSGP